VLAGRLSRRSRIDHTLVHSEQRKYANRPIVSAAVISGLLQFGQLWVSITTLK